VPSGARPDLMAAASRQPPPRGHVAFAPVHPAPRYWRYLTAAVELPDGTREATPQGVPQGGPLSPLLANIALDPLDKELESRGHKFARYADDFIVTVKSTNAAKRVMASLVRYCEGRLQLIVNRAKSRAAPLKTCEFLGYRLNNRAKLAWTEKALHRFKERIREITSRNRGHNVQTVIDELNSYIRGWLNYYKLSATYKEVLALSVWIRRRVRLYYWKQRSRSEAETATPEECPEGGRSPATSRARAVATCWHWERIPKQCIWRRGAAKAIGG
jgi:hypothetical protein